MGQVVAHRWGLGVLFTFFLLGQAVFSLVSQGVRAEWLNVPPVPAHTAATMTGLGDPQLAYRVYGITIQNLGDTGGRTVPLYRYDFERLARWFVLEDALDPQADFIPYLAAFYFGATQESGELGPLIDYLALAGSRPEGGKWRWLAQAVYLARFRLGDLNRAMTLASRLAVLPVPDLPGWARQMPAFIASARGDRDTAYALTMHLLSEGKDTLKPSEINFIVDYLCHRVLEPSAALQHPLCQDLK